MKAVIIRNKDGDVLYVAQVTEIGEKDFIKYKKQAEQNQQEIQDKLVDDLTLLGEQIIDNTHSIKHLKGED